MVIIMNPKIKLIKTIYLYLAAAISLIFVAVGIGTLLNTGLKYAIFPEAEKRSYFECNSQPPVYALEAGQLRNLTSDEQKVQIDQMIREYENWKEGQTGDACIIPARQNKIIDALTMIIIALPILLIHWRLIRKEKEEKEQDNQ